jgi:hypothetical protein
MGPSDLGSTSVFLISEFVRVHSPVGIPPERCNDNHNNGDESLINTYSHRGGVPEWETP